MRPPPGYPFPGELESVPPPSLASRAFRSADEHEGSSLGAAGFVLAFAAAMTGAGFLLAGLVAAEARRAATPSVEVRELRMTSSREDPANEIEPSTRVVDAPLVLPPPIERNVPVFPARFLEGCSAADMGSLDEGLSAAIARGAALYDEGDVIGCADAYLRAARELEGSLPASCGGPIKALVDGRAAADKLALPSQRAWALRDSFDGLVEVMDRSRAAGVESL